MRPSLRQFIIFGFILSLLPATPGYARRGAEPISRGQQVVPIAALPVTQLPPVGRTARLAQDARRPQPAPLRYAVPVAIDITPQTGGSWEQLANGDRLWRLRFHAPGATDLNFGFTRFWLPVGGSLHILSEASDYYEGPYTDYDNKAHEQLWTPPVPGDRALIELYIPAESVGEPDLRLTQVSTGYRDLLDREKRVLAKQGSCNNDVICPEGDPWRNQIRSVATYSLGGSTLCTGSLIMDAEGTFRPFFLSANHCGINAGNASSMVVFWNFESPACGQLGGGSMTDNQTGASFRAVKTDVDMALVELDTVPDPTFSVFYSGWDRSGTVPQGSVGIHHPNTDEKAISFNDDALATINSCIGSGGTNTHWEVDNWEDGTTEPGSSGSGLWDPATKKLVGFLSGGAASCTNPLGLDCYGKFSVAWDSGSSSADRLQDWLDPNDQGPLMVAGANPAPTVFFVSHQGTDSCSNPPTNTNGVWEPGETVEVAVTLSANQNFTNVQGTLTSTSPGVTIVDGTATWPNLIAGVNTTSNPPHFRVRLASSITCLSQVDFSLMVTTAEGGPFTPAFSDMVGEPATPNVPLAIPDQGTANSTLNVLQTDILTDVNVFVDITHTYVGDLSIKLTSPAGTEVILLDRPGVPASTFGCSDNDMQVTFDDASGFDPENHCPATTPWYTGEAAPVGSLSLFNGESPAGTWTLSVTDGAGGDSGTLVNWQLLTDPPLDATCTVCQDVASLCGGPVQQSSQWVLMDEVVTGPKDYKATQSISAGPAFTITSTGCVGFSAGGKIELQPGFRVKQGGELKAVIE